MRTKFRGVSIAEYEEEAGRTLDGDAQNYYNSGSDGEATFTENRITCGRYRLRPRILRGVSGVDLSTTILGHRISFPVCVAPSAWHKFAHVGAELETARGAVESGVAMTLSSISTTTCSDLTSSHPDGIFFMQSCVLRNKALHRMMLCRLKELGFKAVVLSADCPLLSKRRKELGPKMDERFRSREMLTVNYVQEEALSKAAYERGLDDFFDHIDREIAQTSPVDVGIIQWIETCSGLPIIVKGVLTGKAARLAVDYGADAVWISNHGGRQLDYTISTLDVLPEVVEAVKETNVEVYVDSGFRTGADVFKALALGAQVVFIGRPVLWGLSVGGHEGVCDVLEILREELRLCMVLSGCPNIKSITRDHVIHEGEYLSAKL